MKIAVGMTAHELSIAREAHITFDDSCEDYEILATHIALSNLPAPILAAAMYPSLECSGNMRGAPLCEMEKLDVSNGPCRCRQSPTVEHFANV